MTLKALRSSTLLTTLVTAAILSAAPALAAPAAVATVNGTAIPQSLANLLVAERVSQGTKDTPELRNAIREELIQRELILQDAKKAGLGNQADLQAAMKLAEQNVMIRAYMAQFAQKNPIPDSELRDAYKQILSNTPKEEVKVRLMGFENESKAKAAIAKLDSGDSFTSVVSQSDAQELKANGGDIGWRNTNLMPKPLGEVAVKLGKGKYSAQPIKVDNAWFVMQVEDRRPAEAVPPFDQLKPQISQDLQELRFQQFLAKQRANAKVQ